MEVKASAKFIKTAPRKIKSVCDLIRGKKVIQAKTELTFLSKQAARDLLSLLDSALASAKQKELKEENLYIKEIRCDQGPSLKRWLIGARGRATPIKKRMSHITLVLDEIKKETKKGVK